MKKAEKKLRIDSDCYENDDILAPYWRDQVKRYNINDIDLYIDNKDKNFWNMNDDELTSVLDNGAGNILDCMTYNILENVIPVRDRRGFCRGR